MKHLMVFLSLCAFIGGSVVADDGDDAIKTRLLKARMDFEADNTKARTDLLTQFDLKVAAAQKAGDLVLVKKYRAERDTFEETEELPKSLTTTTYRAALKKSIEKMAAAFALARKEYTQTNKIAEAELVDAELTEFNKNGGVRPEGKTPRAGRNPAVKLQIKVLSAFWGAGDRQSDVAERITELFSQGKSISVNSPDLGTDPAPNVNKILRIKVQVGEQILELTIPDRGELKLSAAK